MATELYPLKMQGIYKPTLWGGQRLRDFGKRDLPDAPIGEVWETADSTPLANGALAGQTLAEAVREWGIDLLGRHSAVSPRFPLLVKLIDANAQLSVQVHPNDAQAAELEGEPWGKTEAWHILAASHDAEIVLGTKDCDDIEILRQHIASGTMEHRLNHLKVTAGDTVYIPAGRIHALGRGIVAYEVQQQSDITYRLYDWNRTDAQGQPRQLHVDKGLRVTELDPQPHTHERTRDEQRDGHTHTTLVTSPYFAMEKLSCTAALPLHTNGDTFAIYTVISGSGQLQWGNQHAALQLGDTWIIPAALGDYHITPNPDGLTLLRAYVPET